MRFGCVRGARSRSGRTVVGRRPGDGSRSSADRLGVEGLDGQRIEIGLESAVVAASRVLAGCGVAVGFWYYRSSIPDAYRTAEILGAAGFIFSLRAVLQI